ncbi:MAG: hypothetical protein V4857_17020 [Pseudomonadota bacterium]
MKTIFTHSALALALLCASAAQAQDAAVCGTLGKLMPQVKKGFPDFKGKMRTDELWQATYLMPGAESCNIWLVEDEQKYEGGKYYQYSCSFDASDKKTAVEMVAELSSGIEACMPEMKRSMVGTTIFLQAPQGKIQITTRPSSYEIDFRVD